ncbi:MAG: hypothetical protein ACOYOS_12010 [Syntrophales bacterium]
MASIQNGPHQTYADEYARVNSRLDELSKALEVKIRGKSFRAKALEVSNPTRECPYGLKVLKTKIDKGL